MIDELDCLCVPDLYIGLLFSSHAAAPSSLHSVMEDGWFGLRETSDGSGRVGEGSDGQWVSDLFRTTSEAHHYEDH